MDRLAGKIFSAFVLVLLFALVFASTSFAARTFEYFEGLPPDYREEGWQGYNYYASDSYAASTSVTLHGYPKWGEDGQFYTCVGWKDGSGNIPAAGSTNHVTFTISENSAVTWIYKKAHEVTFAVSGTDRSLTAWGRNERGQLGIGGEDGNAHPTPEPVGPDAPWAAVAAGEHYTVAIDGDGNLWAWGRNHYGQLGDGTAGHRYFPVRVQDPGGHGVWVSVDVGYAHTLAVKSDGTLWAWGHNGYGQLGSGPADLYAHPTPAQVGSDNDWEAVAAGRIHSLALKEDGTLWAFGSNARGQYGNHETNTMGTPVPAGLDSNGDPMAWSAVAAGEYHTVAIRGDDYTLWAWGDNKKGQLGIGQADTNTHPFPEQVGTGADWRSVAAGSNRTMAIRQDGTLWAWGSNSYASLGIETGDPPAGWIRNPANGHEYALTDAKNWTEAEAEAVSAGAHLVTVNDLAEHEWLRASFVTTEEFWIGFTDQDVEGTWRWVGEASSFTYWASGGEPNNAGGNEDFAVMNHDTETGEWNDKGDNYNIRGIIERAPFTSVPTQVAADLDGDGLPDSDWSFVAAGKAHTLAVKTDGTLWAWGKPDEGRLGWAYAGTTGHLYTLTDHLPWWAAEAKAVSLGGHLVTVNDSAERDWLVTTFGGDERFWIGLNDRNTEGTWVYSSFETSSFFPWLSGEPNNGGGYGEDFVEMNYGSPGRWNDHKGSTLKRGIIECAPDAWQPVQVGLDADWTAVAAGSDHTVALKRDGGLWGFGGNRYGQVGFPTPDHSPEDGVNDPVLSPTQVWSSFNVVSVSAATEHTVALKSDGSLWAWGGNSWGQLGLGHQNDQAYPVQVQPGTRWSAAAAGYLHTAAIKSNGTLWGWGQNNWAQLGLGYPAAVDHSQYERIPNQVGSDDQWVSVVTGYETTLAIKSDGTLWSWGADYWGATGLGKATETSSVTNRPTQVGSETEWKTVSLLDDTVLAIRSDGSLWGWGRNNYGQLGMDDEEHRTRPTPVVAGPSWAAWKAVGTGEHHSVAIRDDGTLWSCGDNGQGQLGLGDNLDRDTPMQVGFSTTWDSVATGGRHALALKEDGTLWAWGWNGWGQLGLWMPGDLGNYSENADTPQPLGAETDWVSLAPGTTHNVAIRGLNRLELDPHAGPRFLPEGTQVVGAAKVIPTDGQGAPYNLTSFTSHPTTFGSAFTVESGGNITWAFEEARAVNVEFAPGVPDVVKNASGAFPAEGENRFVTGSAVALHVDPVVTDPGTGTVYVCTGWTGTGRVPASGDAASVTVQELDQDSSITWIFAEARSLSTAFEGLPEHLQGEYGHQFAPEGQNSGWDPDGPVWSAAGSSQELTPTAYIYDEGGRVRYALDLDGSSATGDLDADGDGKPDGSTIPFTANENSTVTWAYKTELRLRIGVTGLADPGDADADPYSDTYYEPNAFVTVNALKDAGGNRYCKDLIVLSGTTGSPPAQVSEAQNNRMEMTFLFSEPTEISWRYEDAEQWVIGRAIDPPARADGSVKPDPPVDKPEAFFWDGANQTLYAVQPFASAVLEWTNENPGGNKIQQTGYAVWPTDATLWAWGRNTNGQLGDNSTTTSDTPLQVGSDKDWKVAAVGRSHTVAIDQQGRLWAWGSNPYGELGLGASDSNPHPTPTQVGTETDWVAVAAGENHTLAIKENGSLWAWGSNQYGELGPGTIDIDPHPTPTRVGTATDWIAIAAGGAHSLGIRSDGTLWAWGANGEGQLGPVGSGPYTDPRQVGSDTDWIAVAAGSNHTLALKKDGKLDAWGYNLSGSVGSAPGTTGWVAIAAGDDHSLGIKSDGTLWAWGLNNHGQLGLDTIDNDPHPIPTRVGTGTDWVAIAGGYRHSAAVRAGGTLWTWGLNSEGQLGLNDTDIRPVPARVGSDIYWSSIAAGYNHTVALKSRHQKHVAGTPANLQPPDSPNTFEEMHYSEAYGNLPGPSTADPVFDPTGSGKSLLRFSTGAGNPPLFVTVESVDWETMLWAGQTGPDTAAIIGEDVTPPSDVIHDDPEEKNGYVLFEKAYYDGVGDDRAYDRSTREGQIIPVNETTADTSTDRQMVVVWYETDAAGVGWPVKPVRYLCDWPQDPQKIIIASGNGCEPLAEYEYLGEIYVQPDRDQPGYNPNEEHALLLGNKVFALRNDLNTLNGETTSAPYVLLKYWYADTESWVVKVFQVEATDPDHDFSYPIDVGKPILPLMPMDALPKPQNSYMTAGGDWYHQDHKGGHWAKGANDLADTDPLKSKIVMHWYYPLQSGFYYPFRKADGSPVGVGDPIPFLNGGGSHQDAPVDVAYTVSWPEDVKTLNIGETLTDAKYGLPDIVNWAAGEVIFDENVQNEGGPLARLIDPYTERSVPLRALPEGLRTENVEGKLRFPDLPYALRARLFFDPTNEKLLFKGISYDPGIGEPLLLSNIMTVRERDRLIDFEPYWRNAVEDLFWETRNHIAGSQKLAGVPMALSAGAADGEGHVVLAENDDESLEAAPVALHVIKVAGGPYRGEIKVIAPDNVFDEKLTLRHAGDFGGEPEKLYFAWYYKPDNSGLPPRLPESATDTSGWVPFDEGPGMNDITIEGAGKLTLSDNWFMVHYYYGDQPGDGGVSYPALYDDNQTETPLGPLYWSDWAGAPGGETAQLAPGWIKRVVADLNPLDARVKDFRNYAVSTDVSVVTQLGQRYEGDIALSGTPDNLNNLGLIEAYETVMGRAKDFSIDAAPPADYGPVNNAILNAGTRIADFYSLLGNEAYRDAQDPTIGFDTQSGALGTMASSIFAFQNQLSSLLEEELALLRGRDDTMSTTRAGPVYNRLAWNFTQGDGELAYVQAYNVRDMDESGVVDELDAKDMYPQGHGDAWGHYLTAMKVWYQLLRHDHFTWEPRIESVLVGGAPIPVDYLDERKFARTASAKARAGAEIVNLTYRRAYVEEPAGQWQGYKDTDTARAWGVDGWARRAGQGAYFDWAVANAMLAEEDPVSTHTGIQKIDRSTVPELASIAGEFQAIQTQADRADRGLNPLGLAKGVVPFDIDPYLLTPYPGAEVKTHFEQVYDRALGALKNTRTVFDYATQYTLMLRQNEDTHVTFEREIEDQERDYTNRLIEIFGYPYAGDIGPTGTYKSGYSGPDLFHFMVVDLPDITGEPLMGEEVAWTYTFDFEDPDFQDDEQADPILKALNLRPSPDGAMAEITYTIDAEAPWLSRPVGWGQRRAPGEMQMAISKLIQAHASYKRGLSELDGLIGEINAAVDILEARHGVLTHQISVLDIDNQKITDLETDIEDSHRIMIGLRRAAEVIAVAADNFREGSFTSDFHSGLIAGPLGGFTFEYGTELHVWQIVAVIMDAISQGFHIAGDVYEHNLLKYELDIQEAERTRDRRLIVDDARFEVQQMVKELETMEGDVRTKLQELCGLKEVIHQRFGRCQALLAEGERLLTEREVFRKRAAADVQDYRYQDIGFRTFRNDAVEKYRATFELAARYAYLAATAYDYETNLLGSEIGSGRAFLTDIVKQRSPGAIMDGMPVVGKRGLADPLARLGQNFGVYKGQLGFNNPQTETNRFALRRELFRFKDEPASDATWRAELGYYRVDDLWEFPPFRRFCRPFADESIGPQPGLVIPFSTEVNFGYNFFGWPLGGGDSAYDPANFATKIRSVGVWFEGYENAGLSSTPRVYLVPVGADVLRTPDGDDFATREWHVVDQKLPVPFPVSDAELSEESWIPVADSLSDILGGIRRFSSFRAFPDSALGNLSETEIIAAQSTTDTRLIGRSVWNTQWLLIVPGGTLLADPDAGLDAFVDNVTDIKLFFQTYAYSGN